MVEKYGSWFTHDKTSRAMIFEREETKVSHISKTRRVKNIKSIKNVSTTAAECCIARGKPKNHSF